MTTKKTRTGKPADAKTRGGLPAILASIPLTEAVEFLHGLDRHFDLVPSTYRADLEDHLTQIRTAAERLGHRTLGDLTDGRAAFLTAVTGVQHPTAFRDSVQAAKLHPIRNLILTLCLVAAAEMHHDPQEVYPAVVSLKARTAHIKRPLCDDEIVLARVGSIAEFRSLTDRRRPMSYLLNDAGFTPVETTKTTLSDFEGGETPTDVLAAGHGDIDDRYLTLDPWARQLLPVYLQSVGHHPADKSLLFTPRPGPKKTKNPESSASATSTITMTKFLNDLGLKQTDVTASSIRTWRVAHTYLTRDQEEALDLAGIPRREVGTGTSKRLDMTRLLRMIAPALPQQAPTAEPRPRRDFANPTWS